jgi:hypothetical protein
MTVLLTQEDPGALRGKRDEGNGEVPGQRDALDAGGGEAGSQRRADDRRDARGSMPDRKLSPNRSGTSRSKSISRECLNSG